MTNFNKLSEINMGKIGHNFEYKGDKEKFGTFWKCYLLNVKKNMYGKIGIIKQNV